MPAPAAAKPIQFLTEEHKRAQRIFARLMGGESMRAIAASENLSLRRVQQIVRDQLDRRNANPADDFALLQIARLERALDLIGSQIDAGKPSAAHAFVRILDHLNRLAPERLRLKATFQQVGGEVDKMEDKLGRLDAAREALAALLRNFFATGFEPAPIRLAEGRGRAPGLAVSLRAWTRPKNGRALISRCETKRFASHNVSHWNHYGRRISDFAGLFVFNDLTPVFVSPFSRSALFLPPEPHDSPCGALL